MTCVCMCLCINIHIYSRYCFISSGDKPLDLTHIRFLAMHWKNNEKYPKPYVLVQSKDMVSKLNSAFFTSCLCMYVCVYACFHLDCYSHTQTHTCTTAATLNAFMVIFYIMIFYRTVMKMKASQQLLQKVLIPGLFEGNYVNHQP